MFLILAVYVLWVFFFPDIADQYGDQSINQKIRTFKNEYMTPENGITDSRSLFEKMLSWAQSTYTESRDTYTHIRSTIEEKTEQVEKTTESVKKAYEALDTAKKNIDSLTDFSWSLK